jgi:hypothetical protein
MIEYHLIKVKAKISFTMCSIISRKQRYKTSNVIFPVAAGGSTGGFLSSVEVQLLSYSLYAVQRSPITLTQEKNFRFSIQRRDIGSLLSGI